MSRFCELGGGAPATPVDTNSLGSTAGPGFWLGSNTSSTTGIYWGELSAVTESTSIWLKYSPGVRLAASAVTITEGMLKEAASLDPKAGFTDRKVSAPGCAITDAVQCITPIPTLSTLKDCGGTTPPPATAVKVRPVCDRRIVCGTELMVIVTGTVVVDPVDNVTVIVPV